MSGDPDFDLRRLLELADACSAPEFLTVFSRDSLRDAGLAIDRLEEAARAGVWPTVRDRAHAIAGVAANVGAVRVAALARDVMALDELALSRDWPARAEELRSALAAAVRSLEASLHRFTNATPHQ